MPLVGPGSLPESRTILDFLQAAPPNRRLDLDLSQTDWIDSTFLGSLINLHKRMNVTDAVRFRICADPNHTHRLFGRTRLDQVLPQAVVADTGPGPEQTIPESAMSSGALAEFVADCHRRLAELGGPDSAAYQSVADALSKPENPTPG